MENKLQTVEGVVSLMKSSKSEKEWNENCDRVKANNNGYPTFWYKEIVLKGVMSEQKRTWERNN